VIHGMQEVRGSNPLSSTPGKEYNSNTEPMTSLVARGILRGKIHPWDGYLICGRAKTWSGQRGSSAFAVCKRSYVLGLRASSCKMSAWSFGRPFGASADRVPVPGSGGQSDGDRSGAGQADDWANAPACYQLACPDPGHIVARRCASQCPCSSMVCSSQVWSSEILAFSKSLLCLLSSVRFFSHGELESAALSGWVTMVRLPSRFRNAQR
jgi:hypothetical protein